MRLSKEIIDQKLEQVPENIRQAVFSEKVSASLLEIAKKYGLHVDQIGVLEEETLYAMLGLQDPNKFIENIRLGMRISESTAINLTHDVNDQIMNSIRSSIQEGSLERIDSSNNIDEEETRDSILSEIENPSPTIHPISRADQTIAGPAIPTEIVPESSDSDIAQEFISGKLKETVNMPSKKAVTTPEKLSANTNKPPQKIDPYREPIA